MIDPSEDDPDALLDRVTGRLIRLRHERRARGRRKLLLIALGVVLLVVAAALLWLLFRGRILPRMPVRSRPCRIQPVEVLFNLVQGHPQR